MTWYPGLEKRYTAFLSPEIVHGLATSYRDYARAEMAAKIGPVGVREVPYYDIPTLLLLARPGMPPVRETGIPERRTKIQVGGG